MNTVTRLLLIQTALWGVACRATVTPSVAPMPDAATPAPLFEPATIAPSPLPTPQTTVSVEPASTPSADAARPPASPLASQSPRILAVNTIHPLPGGLNQTQVLNSNSPEMVKEDGVLISTFSGKDTDLDHRFVGPFELFLHHIAETAFLDGRDTLWIGLLGRADESLVRLKMLGGVSHLTGPDAPFKELAPLVDDPEGQVYSGPGSRVAVDQLMGRAGQLTDYWQIEAGKTRLLQSWPIPAKNFLIPGRNARSGIFRFEADSPVRLAAVALYGRSGDRFELADYEKFVKDGKRAGPPDKAATIYNPRTLSFVYGRVAGVQSGARWVGTLFDKASDTLKSPGDWLGFPIAALYGNTLGTRQIQAPDLLKRYPTSAVQAQGSYGVLYELTIPLDNPGDTACQYALGFSSPLKMTGDKPGAPMYGNADGKPVMFRGPLRLDWLDTDGKPRQLMRHITLRQGEAGRAFAELGVPPRQRINARLSLIYPADCTPTQLLTITRS
jgi:hypothetical protein